MTKSRINAKTGFAGRIIIHPGVLRILTSWASDFDSTPGRLRQSSMAAIRRRHHEATIHRPAHGSQPDIMRLGFGALVVFYTVEPHAVVIRGFGTNMPDSQLDEDDPGGLFSEYRWAFLPSQG